MGQNLNELADCLCDAVVASLKTNIDQSRATALSNKVRYNRFLFGELTDSAKKVAIKRTVPSDVNTLKVDHVLKFVKVDCNDIPEKVLTEEIRSILKDMVKLCE